MRRPLLAVLLALFVLPTPSDAQEPGDGVAAQETSAQDLAAGLPSVEDQRRRVAELSEADPPAEAPLLERAREVLAALEAIEAAQARRATFREQAEAAPRSLERLQEQVAEPAGGENAQAGDAGPQEGAALAELQQGLKDAEAERELTRQRLDELQREVTRQATRLQSLPDELARRRAELTAKVEELASLEQGSERRLLVQAQARQAEAELEALRAERDALEAQRELLPLQVQRTSAALERLAARVAAWSQAVTARQQQDAEDARLEAEERRRETIERYPRLTSIATEIGNLTQERADLAGKAAGERVENAETLRLAEELEQHYRNARERIQVAGLTKGTGSLLRSDFDMLPSRRELERESRDRREELSEVQVRVLELRERVAEAKDVDRRLQELLGRLGSAGPAQADDELREYARDLLKDELAELEAVLGVAVQYRDLLEEHERRYQTRLRTTVEAYGRYIEERILWVPSVEQPFESLGRGIGAALAWLLGVPEGENGADIVLENHWLEALDRSLRFCFDNLPETLGWALLITLLFAAWHPLRQRIEEISDQVRSYRSDSMRLTLQALAIVPVQALAVPLLLHRLGWVLAEPGGQAAVAVATGQALQRIVPGVYLLEFLRRIARPKHLGQVHFRWPARSMGRLRSTVRYVLLLVLPPMFLAHVFDAHGEPLLADSLGRLAFMAGALGGLWVMGRALRPASPLWSDAFRRSGSLFVRLHRLWFALVLLVPLGLLALPAAGYSFTAFQLEQRMVQSVAWVVLLAVVNATLLRWLFLARRRMAVERARQRAQARAAEQEQAGVAITREGGSIDEDSVDIPAVDQQTRKLFRTGITLAAVFGLYFIWSSSLPALRALDRVQLWPELRVISAQQLDQQDELLAAGVPLGSEVATTPATDGAVQAPQVPGLPPGVAPQAPADQAQAMPAVITLGDLGLALLLLLVTTVAARNIPGLLEMGLQRMELDSGSRYAVATLVSYLILVVGIASALGAVGIGWENIQWLAAALTFGLAFGLQEIFANFVSGLIILIERPVRVGDIVTVDGIDGRVTRLRMRATTIMDWDRRELLIPNKSFITSSIVNWTLTDPVTRVVIPVGIAYGSDTARAREILVKVAREHPLIMKDPEPHAIFEHFGESSLDFTLRFFIESRDYWLAVMDQVHTGIDQAFRAAGIEIAFPQRDLHVRSGLEGLARATPVQEGPPAGA